MDRIKITGHADQYWWRPCADGKLWLRNSAISIPEEMRKRNFQESDYTAVFLTYNAQRYVDGLYLVANEVVPKLAQYHYHESELPPNTWVQVIDWWGPNDCTHFLTECLQAGGIGIQELAVAKLVPNLRSRKDTKTLAHFVDFNTAQRIVRANIMKPGDVLAFGTMSRNFTEHAHAVLYMGKNKVANHTHLNHPDYTGGGTLHGSGQWKQYTDNKDDHPLVTLIHFSSDDAAVTKTDPMLGWWGVTWQAKPYHYLFEKSGRVTWQTAVPASVTAPATAPKGKGYWFQYGNEIKICWTDTGTLEEFTLKSRIKMEGMCSGAPGIVAAKL